MTSRDDDAAGASRISTPAARIENLRKLAQDAERFSPADQEIASSQLAQSLETEIDPLIRVQILRTLAAFPTRRAEDVLLHAVKDADPDVRIATCDAWGARGGEQATAVLCEVLQSDTSVDVRLAAARCLAVNKDVGAVPALGTALDDPDPAIQFRAVQSLKAITGKSYITIDDWRGFAQGSNPRPPSLVERVRSWF